MESIFATMSGRRTPRRFFRGPKKSYSIERQIFNATLTSAAPSGNTVVVPASTEQGKRKVKNFSIQFVSDAQAPYCNVVWALVYVPEGYTPNAVTHSNGSLYEPNQNVIAAGVLNDLTSATNRVFTPMSRNLNSGDRIYLLLSLSPNLATESPLTTTYHTQQLSHKTTRFVTLTPFPLIFHKHHHGST